MPRKLTFDEVVPLGGGQTPPRRWPELRIVLAFAMLAGGLWGFAWLAGEVLEGDTLTLDTRLLLLLRNPADASDPLGPLWFEQMARDFTALGSVGVLTLVTLAVVGFLILTRRGAAAVTVAASIGSGWLVTEALKHGFERPRPDLVPHGTVVFTSASLAVTLQCRRSSTSRSARCWRVCSPAAA